MSIWSTSKQAYRPGTLSVRPMIQVEALRVAPAEDRCNVPA
jgi:hypothetical protein